VLAGHSKAGTDLFHISVRTYLVVRIDHGAEVSTFTDFKNVGGIVVPHRIRVQDALGESEMTLRSIRFDVPLPGEVFRLKKPDAPAPDPAS
jgi:hypothetical protein